MTLNQILYFQKVARLENYHQAAEELYISQPSLSRSMAALESELGVALFEKKGRGVTLTKAGYLFLEHADRIAGDCDVAVGKMQELSSDGGIIHRQSLQKCGPVSLTLDLAAIFRKMIWNFFHSVLRSWLSLHRNSIHLPE